MADMIMTVDIALAEVPVNVFPLTDDTDFKTRETAVAYNAAGMDLVWNFVTIGGAMTQTAVTPTTAGDYDWAHQGDGMYSIEIPASGGASINNDTEGFGWFTGFATGVLPWRGPVIAFVPANTSASLIAGTDALDVNAIQFAGQTITAAAGVTLPASVASPTNITGGTITTVTNLTNAPTSGDFTATMKTSLVTGVTAGSAAIADRVWDEVMADHVTGGTTGASLNGAGSAGDPWTTALPGAYGSGTAGKILGDNLNATVGSRSSQTSVDDLPTNAELATALGTADDAILAVLTTISGYLDTEIAAIKAKTDNLPASPAAVGSAMTLTSGERDSIAAALLDLANAIETGLTLRNALRLVAAASAGKVSGMTTTTVILRNAVADSKDRVTATVDAIGNRTAITTDLT